MSPLNKPTQSPDLKALTENEKIDFANCFANLLSEYTDLAEIVKVWPDLPEHIKAAIKALIQTHITEKK